MQSKIRNDALLAGALLAVMLTGTASSEGRMLPHRRVHHAKVQEKTPPKPKEKIHHRIALTQIDLGAGYTAERGKLATQEGNGFWLQGASFDGAFTFYRGLGFATNISVDHASNISQSTGISKTTLVFGPRYTQDTSRWIRFGKVQHSQVYGEALFGVAHGFNSLFPIASGTSAGSPAMQLGAGLDLAVWKGLSIRPVELDFIHTGFPNGAANSQNDFRMSFGVSYRFNITGKQRKSMERPLIAAKRSVHPRKAVARVRHPRTPPPGTDAAPAANGSGGAAALHR